MHVHTGMQTISMNLAHMSWCRETSLFTQDLFLNHHSIFSLIFLIFEEEKM